MKVYKNRLLDIIVLCFCFGILIFCLFISYFRQVGTFAVETDFYGVYAIEASNILTGKLYTYQHNPPGYCLILAGVTYLTKDIFLAGKLISTFSTPIFIWINYLTLKYLFEATIALIVTIISLLAFFPSPLVVSTDILGATLIILSIWLYLTQKYLLFLNYFLSGIVAGMAYLVRANAIFISIGIITSLLVINPQQKNMKKRFLSIILFVSGLILIISPWLIYNWQINGSPFASTAYAQIAAHFYHPQGDNFITAVNQMGEKFNSLSEVILYNPTTFIKSYLKDIVFINISSLLVSNFLIQWLINNDFTFDQIFLIVLPALFLFVTGLIFIIKDRINLEISKARITFLFIMFLGYLILGLVGFNRRYYLFMLPCIFLIIIYPIYYQRIFTKILNNKFIKFKVSTLLIIVLTFCVFISAGLETYSLLNSEPKYLIEIAGFLKNKYEPNQNIIVRKPHLAYLSNLNPVFPLAETAEEYLSASEKVHAKLIVYSDYEAKLWQGLKSLKHPEFLPKNFILVYHHRSSNTIIYEIKK